MADVMSSWQKIQSGMKETERLISQKKYNLSMIKARQTLEFMVKILGEKACVVDGDLSDVIDQLYEGQWINKATKDRYHRIRIIGNKAVHEGNDRSSDALQAYQLLAQEVSAFADELGPARRRPASGQAARKRPVPKSAPDRNRKYRKKKKSPAEDILRILVPLICVVLLIFIIRALLPDKEDSAPTQPPTTAETTPEPTVTPTESEPPQETETVPDPQPATITYKTTSTLNVRAEPSTSARILVQLGPSTEVTATGTYDSQWTIINYDGQDAYVATAYLTTP